MAPGRRFATRRTGALHAENPSSIDFEGQSRPGDALKALITGASGLLGHALLAAPGAEAVGTCRSRTDQSLVQLEITDACAVLAVLERDSFDVVIHCAAISDVELCEADASRAWAINYEGTAHVAAACASRDVRLVHISTDWVFDGSSSHGYDEADPRHPLQVYGRTKAAAEDAALSHLDSVVVRLPLLWSSLPDAPRPTWPDVVLAAIAEGIALSADDTELRQPVDVVNVAPLLLKIAALDIVGVVHLAPASAITKYRWAKALAESVGSDALIRSVPTTSRARRPRQATLLTRRLRSLGLEPPPGIAA